MQCARADEVPAALARVAAAVEGRGLYAAGFIAYEAAAAFGLAVRAPGPDPFPRLWFGLYDRREEVGRPVVAAGAPGIGPWAAALGADEHAGAFRCIQAHIAAGDTYQVNYTFPLRAVFAGDPWAFFCDLTRAQRAGQGAYFDLGRYAVCSASPELFFRLEGDLLTTRPMKGTAGRGCTLAEDEGEADRLRGSPKDRAENLMIVDMLRNDLGRVAALGSVRVPALFEVERYPTLLQMTSTVTARSMAPLPEILAALFPCASVTGAPKRRTMQIIAALEPFPRGLYTGAIGHLAPGRRACFSVAIRTAVVDRQRGEAVYGVGSGVVADSVAGEEYAECLLKARVLAERPFRLLETLRWTPGEGYFLLEAHLERLLASARYFGADLQGERVREALSRCAGELREPSRVRLTADLEGGIEVEGTPLGPPLPAVRIGLARDPVDGRSPWLYHKTTRREAYEAALRSRPDCDDVILWNERGEATEASRSNLVVEGEDGFVTPPLACGALPGTLRARLLASGRIRERVIPVGELAGRRLHLINSVRGWQGAVLVPGAHAKMGGG